jgi:hypothetical protein
MAAGAVCFMLGWLTGAKGWSGDQPDDTAAEVEQFVTRRAPVTAATQVLPVVPAPPTEMENRFVDVFEALATHGRVRGVPPPPPIADVDDLAGTRWDTAGMHDVYPSDDDPAQDTDDDLSPPAAPDTSAPDGGPEPAPTAVPPPGVAAYRYTWAHLAGPTQAVTLVGVMPSDRLRGTLRTGLRVTTAVRERALRLVRAVSGPPRPRRAPGWRNTTPATAGAR